MLIILYFIGGGRQVSPTSRQPMGQVRGSSVVAVSVAVTVTVALGVTEAMGVSVSTAVGVCVAVAVMLGSALGVRLGSELGAGVSVAGTLLVALGSAGPM